MEHTEASRAVTYKQRWRLSNSHQRRDGARTKDEAISLVLHQGAERVLKGCQLMLSQEIRAR